MRTIIQIGSVLFLSILLLACRKAAPPPIEEIIVGNWSITQANHKPGPFKAMEDVSAPFQHFEYTFTANGTVSFRNAQTQESKTGAWSLVKIPQNVSGPEGMPVWYVYEYIYLIWDNAPQQEWLLGSYKPDQFYATESKGNGSYTYQLSRQ